MSLKISSDSNFEIWTGEHWQSYLRVPGNDENSGSFSLYLTDHSVFGSGIVVLVNIPEISSLSGVYTDNLKLSSFILNKIVSKTSDYPFPDEMEIYDSDILRFEDSSGEIGWRIIHSQNEIIAKWSDFKDPFFHSGGPQNQKGQSVLSSLLIFAQNSSIQVNKGLIKGIPYDRPTWKRTTGSSQSSCVIAFSEIIKIVDQN